MMYVWGKDEPFGTELAALSVSARTLEAHGVAIGVEPLPYRLDYELSTVDEFVTARLVVRTQGDGWRRALVLERLAVGAWVCTPESEGFASLPAPGGDVRGLNGALDCDLGLSPLTNSMPVLRHGLHEGGGPVDFLMAWVSVPDLSVHPSRQRYTFLQRQARARLVRFEAPDATFVADILFDDNGVVIDYPGIARRIV
jgi:uncharacterized protein